MAASHYPASQLAALGREWVEAWNSRVSNGC